MTDNIVWPMVCNKRGRVLDGQYNLANGGRGRVVGGRASQPAAVGCVPMLPVATVSRYRHTGVCVCNFVQCTLYRWCSCYKHVPKVFYEAGVWASHCLCYLAVSTWAEGSLLLPQF